MSVTPTFQSARAGRITDVTPSRFMAVSKFERIMKLAMNLNVLPSVPPTVLTHFHGM